jgi:hypothetical protein
MKKAEQECKTAWGKFEQHRNFSESIPNCVWDIDIELPKPPAKYKDIANFGLPKEKRKFPYYSKDLIKEIDSLNNTDPKKKEFLDEEWRRRKEGYWFYNGDNLEWVTGHYYMTLQYWLIPIEDLDGDFGNPKFVDLHRDISYAIWWEKNDERDTGLALAGGRRSGKTMIGMSHGYFDTTERYNALFGIQSKTDTDSKGVLLKLVSSWQRLPKFLKPVDTGYTTVSRELMFSEPQRRSAKGIKREYKEVLNSRIYAYPSTETAMDGQRTTFQFQDEGGKRKDSNAYKTQQISKICCVVGRKVVGFSFWATTVEEMEKGGGEAYKAIWDASDPNDRNENGRTTSTMVRVFFPAEYGLFEGGFIDEWGYSMLEEAGAWLDSEEKALDGEDLLDWKRKFPRNIDDAFAIPTNNNSYNQRKLYEQWTYNDRLDPIAQPTQGNFYWEGGMKDTQVLFAPDPNGRWLVAWMPPVEDRNKKEIMGGHWKPTRDFCKTGADPFAHKSTEDKGSMAAGFTILQSHYTVPKMKMAWACQYLARPNSPQEAAEDMIMQCVFYSSMFLSEKNVYGMLQHFDTRGYDGYCMFNPLDPDSDDKRRKGMRGMPMTGADAGEALCDITQAHINDTIGYHEEDKSYGFCPFNDLVSDWQKFDPNKRTKFDCAMAAGMTLIATKKAMKKIDKKYTSASDWLPKWDNRGGISERIK